MTTRPLTFTLRTWTPDHPGSDGIERRDYRCDRCDCNGSYPVPCEDPDLAKHLAATKDHVCPPAPYPWDDWRREAFERGMDPETAAAGRQLFREHYNHAWGGHLDCRGMMRAGLRSPTFSREKWDWMLAEGGEAEFRGERPNVQVLDYAFARRKKGGKS